MMTPQFTIAPAGHEPDLAGQSVLVIGGSAGIGLETARRAREEGSEFRHIDGGQQSVEG